MNLAKRINLHYTTIQGTFGVGFSALMSYGAVLMLSRGLSNSALGVVTCIAQLMPLLLQPMAAGLTQKYEPITPRRMIMILGVLVFAAAAVMMCFSQALWVIIIGFICVAVALNLILPFFNIIMVSYLVRGVEVNFGLGRGFGSGAYALATFVLGFVLSALAGMWLNLVSVLRAIHLRAKPFHWFVRPLLSALLMGMWCLLFFRILTGAGCSGGLACLLCTLLGIVLYVAALLAQGISVTQYLPKRKKCV